jgi:hypothetical protein
VTARDAARSERRKAVPLAKATASTCFFQIRDCQLYSNLLRIGYFGDQIVSHVSNVISWDSG